MILSQSGPLILEMEKVIEIHLLTYLFYAIFFIKLSAVVMIFNSFTNFAIVVFKGPNLLIGNIGDSRAVLATRDMENSLAAVQLTIDLKPNLPSISRSL